MSHTKLRPILIPLVGGLLSIGAFGALIASCGGGDDTPSGPAGGDVAGSADMHCVLPDGGLITQSTDAGNCQFRPPIDAPPLVDAGPDGPPESDFGATMYDQSGNDDDCKYHVAWTATPIYENFNVFFTVVATVINTTNPVIGANIQAEVYLSDTHEAPPTAQKAVESPPGTYKVGPIQFDQPGQWTVRFHLFENCLDYADDSPHGHAAFFVNVP